MRLTIRELRRIIREEYSLLKENISGQNEGWLGEWYEECGGYYKDVDCFYVLDKCFDAGVIDKQDAMAVCSELARYGITTLEDLKQNWCEQRTSATAAWKAMYASMDPLQDLFKIVDAWRNEDTGLRFPPGINPYATHVGGPAFVTCAWCISVC